MIPQLGFNHEDSGQRFVLDLADLHRDKLTIPAAFRAVPIEDIFRPHAAPWRES
jgi:CRISP-associated protein Cas1